MLRGPPYPSDTDIMFLEYLDNVIQDPSTPSCCHKNKIKKQETIKTDKGFTHKETQPRYHHESYRKQFVPIRVL